MLSQRVEQIETNKFLIPDSTETYDSLGHLISSFQDRKDPLHLTECLPPSEYGTCNNSNTYIGHVESL